MSSNNLPTEFRILMHRILQSEMPAFEHALSQNCPVSIRANSQKASTEEFSHLNISESVPWCPDGYYLDTRPSFTLDPLFHSGCYYVQEASSMFIGYLLKKFFSSHPVHILDLCAAPGGKSTHILSEMPEGSLLFANEIIRSRCNILIENIIKWGNPNVIVTNNSSEDYKSSGVYFDIILCDAPCSGEGMFRKEAQSLSEWSVSNVSMCSLRQREILHNIWDCLKPGGLLIYSTCTYNTDEDECNAQYIKHELGGKPLFYKIDDAWGIVTTNYLKYDTPVYHFFPHKIKGEGFFTCLFQKPLGSQCLSNKKPHKKDKKNHINNRSKELQSWIKDSNNYHFISNDNGELYAINKNHQGIIHNCEKKLRVLHKGIKLASLKGKKYTPSHSLAMSTIFNPEKFPSVELDLSSALSYLHCDSLRLPDAPRGHILVKYKGHPLGFVNNVGNHANNLYPQEWRIRMNITT